MEVVQFALTAVAYPKIRFLSGAHPKREKPGFWVFVLVFAGRQVVEQGQVFVTWVQEPGKVQQAFWHGNARVLCGWRFQVALLPVESAPSFASVLGARAMPGQRVAERRQVLRLECNVIDALYRLKLVASTKQQ